MDVEKFVKDYSTHPALILEEIQSGEYIKKIGFKKLEKVNVNGKRRKILMPDIYTLTMQHISILLLAPYYSAKDPFIGINCKKGCGVNAAKRRGSVVKRVKHIFYDRRDFTHVVIIDQRKCYDHITRKIYRHALKLLGVPKWLIDFSIFVSFMGNVFPIGTPTSPLAHHIICLTFDKWLKQISSLPVRYADDVLVPAHTVEEANEIKWRIKNFWWYELQMRAKPYNVRIQPMTLPADFCGVVFRRNPDKGVCDHNKGYAVIRKNIADRARKSTEKSYPSYFGIFKSVDGYAFLRNLEQRNMNLQQLTEKIRINRSLDAPNISPKDLADAGFYFTIHDYEIRRDKSNEPNWIKCLISYKSDAANGRRISREFHGNYQSIIQFIVACEKVYSKENILPLTGVKIISGLRLYS